MPNRKSRHRSHSGRMRVPELKPLSDAEFVSRLTVIRDLRASQSELDRATADEWEMVLETRATPEQLKQLKQLRLLKQEALV